MPLKIVAISDVHCRWNKLIIPKCDILISSGDYSYHGEKHVVKDFHTWLNKQPAEHIISVQGNHETWVEKNFEEAKTVATEACPRVHFMDEGLVEIEGLKIWCSAITPWFYSWAWNRHRGPNIEKHWALIPDDTDILITHGPPKDILDGVPWIDGTIKETVGCEELRDRIAKVHPAIHIFGHIHHGHGEHHEKYTSYYNASICDEQYKPINPITVIEYDV